MLTSHTHILFHTKLKILRRLDERFLAVNSVTYLWSNFSYEGGEIKKYKKTQNTVSMIHWEKRRFND